MAKTAAALVAKMQSWVGLSRSDGSYQKILDIYNGYTPLPRGHRMTSADAWCAATVSAAAIACGMTDILPPECSCNRMIALFKSLGEWQENEKVTPAPGWVIFYDWDDSGSGDNTGKADHVGVVEKVSGGVITVIEGNYSGKVKRREVKVNGRYIRGYGVPKFDPEKPLPEATHKLTAEYTVVRGDTPESIAKCYAITVKELIAANIGKYPKMTADYIQADWVLSIPRKTKEIGGPYHVEVSTERGLNVREGPSTSSRRVAVLKCGDKATVLGLDETGEWGMILYKDAPRWIFLAYTREA